MSLESFKITQSQVVNNGVSSAPDKLTGSAADNKAVFDNLVKTIVANSINEIINILTSPSGAQSIGMQDLYGEQDDLNVVTAVNKMRLKIDSDKTDKTVTNAHLKNVEYNKETGTFKFIRENGDAITVDTALEKISINFAYSPETESLIITLFDGTTQTVPLSSLISENEWNESATVKFNVSDHKVSAVVKYDSITDEHLSSTLRETLISYVTESQGSAQAASEAKALSEKYKNDALAYADQAREAKTGAVAAQGNAEKAKSGAVAAQDAAEKAKSAAEEAAEEAKTARDGAVEISGFKPSLYAKFTDLALAKGRAGLVELWTSSSGLVVNNNNKLSISPASDEEILNKTTGIYRPLIPSKLDLAVKVGLTTNTLTLTDEEKANAKEFLGFDLEMVVERDGNGTGESVEVVFPQFNPDYIIIKKRTNAYDDTISRSFKCTFEPMLLNEYSVGECDEIKIKTSDMANGQEYVLCNMGSSMDTLYTISVTKTVSQDGSCNLLFTYNNESTTHELDKSGYIYEYIGVKEV